MKNAGSVNQKQIYFNNTSDTQWSKQHGHNKTLVNQDYCTDVEYDPYKNDIAEFHVEIRHISTNK